MIPEVVGSSPIIHPKPLDMSGGFFVLHCFDAVQFAQPPQVTDVAAFVPYGVHHHMTNLIPERQAGDVGPGKCLIIERRNVSDGLGMHRVEHVEDFAERRAFSLRKPRTP